MNAFSRPLSRSVGCGSTLNCLMIVALMAVPALAAEPAAKPLVFNTTRPVNDLKGSLAARVQFAQSQIVPARSRAGDPQPHLIGHRTSLLLVRPLKADGTTPIQVTARNKAGKTLGSLALDPPENLPKTAYAVDGIPDEPIDFTTKAAPALVNNRRDLERLGDTKQNFLINLIRMSPLVEIQLADGQWVSDIHVPGGMKLDGKLLRVRSAAGYSSTVHYSGREVVISRDQTLNFKHVRGQWVLDSELENQGLTYATDTWSGVLPAGWIVPGLSLQGTRAENWPISKWEPRPNCSFTPSTSGC